MLKTYSESDNRCGLEFKNLRCNLTIHFNEEDCTLYWKELNEPFTVSIGLIEDNGNINDEWELLKTPVEFKDAFLAWYYEGRIIYCDVYDGEWNRENDINHVYDQFPAHAIAEGKWYIKE